MLYDIFKIDKPHFGWKSLRACFAPKPLLYGLLSALLLSAFIYLSWLGFRTTLLLRTAESLTALAAFYILLTAERRTLYWAGFFTGLLWFYWIAFSFRYYDVRWLMPFMIFFVAFAFGLFFWLIGLFRHPLPRAVLFWLFGYFHPLSFNWFIPELSLIHTFFGIDKLHFALFLLSIVLFVILPRWWRATAVISLILAVNPHYDVRLPLSKTKVMLDNPRVSQSVKWNEAYLPETIDNNLATILEAISEGYDMVVLPESVFPMFLNTDIALTKKLLDLSHDIVIVAGALYSDGQKAYNSTYYFDHGKIYIANKVVLVPFGEEIPLPKFIARWINDTFYNGAEDYHTAKKPVDLNLSTGTFRNAICYEATRDELFVGHPGQMIAISNNAWFTPSIEPTLQRLLLEYFSKKYGTVIYHSANMGISTIIH